VDDRRVLTVPNAITVARLLCVPLFLWLLFGAEEREAAFALLGVLGATDWVDGWIARHFDQGSNLGKVLDPVADRVLLMTAGIALVVQGSVPLVVGILVLARELVISIAVLVLAAAGARRIDVQWAGKAGTLALMFSFPLFLWADSIATGHDAVLALAWIFAVGGLLLSYYAAFEYVPLARVALREGRGRPVLPPARAREVVQ
jgi:cardiolipin synthase